MEPKCQTKAEKILKIQKGHKWVQGGWIGVYYTHSREFAVVGGMVFICIYCKDRNVAKDGSTKSTKNVSFRFWYSFPRSTLWLSDYQAIWNRYSVSRSPPARRRPLLFMSICSSALSLPSPLLFPPTPPSFVPTPRLRYAFFAPLSYSELNQELGLSEILPDTNIIISSQRLTGPEHNKNYKPNTSIYIYINMPTKMSDKMPINGLEKIIKTIHIEILKYILAGKINFILINILQYIW